MNVITIGLDYSHNNKLTLESSSYNEFTHFLFSSGYKLGKIQVGFDSLKKLETYDCIILSSPQNKKLEPNEIEVLEEYVKNGGNILIISSLGGDYSNKTNLNELTVKFGFEFMPNQVSDSVNYITLQKRPLLTNITPHAITEQVKRLVFSSACSLKVLEFLEDDQNIKIDVIATGGLNTWHRIYDGKDWIEEDSPRVPLIVAVEYYNGRVVGFGNLSMFSSLGREYGFSAFDNNLFIANTLKYMTSGAISSAKIVNVNLNIDLYYWANKILDDQNWENVSDIINVSLKYFKDHYNEAIKNMKKLRVDKLAKRKAYEKAKVAAEQETAEDKILEMIPVRKREDLEEIMRALEVVTGEKYEISIDLEEDVEAEQKEVVKPKEKEVKVKIEKGLEYTSQDIKDFEKETSKNAIWRGKITKNFIKWLAEKKKN